MNEMATGADQVNIVVNNINGLTNKNRDTAATLKKEVEKFKID
jgi:methyl-accepting chemotaxis protein